MAESMMRPEGGKGGRDGTRSSRGQSRVHGSGYSVDLNAAGGGYRRRKYMTVELRRQLHEW